MPETGVLSTLLDDAAALLAARGSAEPAREALRVWAGLRQESPASAFLSRAQRVEPTAAATYSAAIARRAAGEPLAYVTGWVGFRELTLRADQRALIPRPETEGLVDQVLARVPRGRVADVGTGSGCIALSLAQEGRYHAVVATDCSRDALALASENAACTGLAVTLVCGDLCAPLALGQYDALVSNPPYLTDAEYSALDPSVGHWEPERALQSGPDGLAATVRLLTEGQAVLRPGGWIALEVDCYRATLSADRARALGWADVAIHADLFGRERYLLARRSTDS